MKIFGRKGLEVQKLGFWKIFARVWLLVKMYGVKIVLGVYIGWEKRVTIEFCYGQKI